MDDAQIEKSQNLTVEDEDKDLEKYHKGTSCIIGVYVEATKKTLSIYRAMIKKIISKGTALQLLEAQAATGIVIDPIINQKLTVSEAVKMRVVCPVFEKNLLSAERAVTGYTDPYSGRRISLLQAIKMDLIDKYHGIRLLKFQIATGGIIEGGHRLSVEVAYERNLLDENIKRILTDPSSDTINKSLIDPNTGKNLTYSQMMEQCITDPETGFTFLLLKKESLSVW